MRKNKIMQGGKLPRHIAIIMDGNGRWAKKRALPRSVGHKCGMERMVGLIEHAFGLGVDCITVYALSTENLKRPKEELDGLFDLFRSNYRRYLAPLCEKGVCVRAIGNIALLPEDVREILEEIEKKSPKDATKSVNVAVCYGARDEIIRAVNFAIEKGERVTETEFSSLLYTQNTPDPDLIIRTGKEVRLSNFLLYQAAYAELYFSKKMFPAFSNKDLEKAIVAFSRRTRRFGKTDEQL